MAYIRLNRNIPLAVNKPELLDLTSRLKSVLQFTGVLDITYDITSDVFIVFHVGNRPLPVSEINYNRKGERGYGLYCGWSVQYVSHIWPHGNHYRGGKADIINVYRSPIFPYVRGKSDITKALGGQLLYREPYEWEQLEFVGAFSRDQRHIWEDDILKDCVDLSEYLPSFMDDPIVSWTRLLAGNGYTFKTRSGILYWDETAMLVYKNDGLLDEQYKDALRLTPDMLQK